MRRALYPGTFDPVTFGHLDLVRRGAALFDQLTVGTVRHLGAEHRVVLGERVLALHLEVRLRVAGDRVEEDRLLDGGGDTRRGEGEDHGSAPDDEMGSPRIDSGSRWLSTRSPLTS